MCTVVVHVPCLSKLESPGDRGMAGAGLTGFRPNLDGTWPRRSFINTFCVELFPPMQLPYSVPWVLCWVAILLSVEQFLTTGFVYECVYVCVM